MSASHLLALALPLVLLPGCLDARRGGESERSDAVNSDSGDPGPVDTFGETAGPNDSTPSDAADPCATLDCDDGDDCTFDICADGLCVHTPLAGASEKAALAEPPECLEDAHCDDGDPCSYDTCVLRPGTCTVAAWGYCSHAVDERCGTNCDVESENMCEDGDPCTLDTCVTGQPCMHAPIGDDLCDSACSARSESLGNVMISYPVGAYTTTRGTIGMTPTDCPDSDTSACTGGASLVDGRFMASLIDDPRPTCTVDFGPPVCAPLAHNTSYIVWGKTAFYDPRDDAGAMEFTSNAIDMDGYCLEITDGNLVGEYDGRFVIEGEDVLLFRASIFIAPTGFITLQFSSVTETNGPWSFVDPEKFAVQQPMLYVKEQRIGLALELPWRDSELEREQVYLFARGNQLAGTVGPLFLREDGEAGHGAVPPSEEDTLPFGAFHLTRSM